MPRKTRNWSLVCPDITVFSTLGAILQKILRKLDPLQSLFLASLSTGCSSAAIVYNQSAIVNNDDAFTPVFEIV